MTGGKNLYFSSFLGAIELFTITDYGDIITLGAYIDTPEVRQALVSLYGAAEVTGWKKV
ncbi:hypothetical protein [uncultured Dysosmobacter sp.]|uniref:hypothetical protein n=1 Tax=uncultured Dysosmobacter sp. TaxID=2591384 RepID=UPI00261C7B34|nr:hypothetical protein [uncultured Dysosmobacter sp.]